MTWPDSVTLSIAELAGDLQVGLLAFVAGSGMKTLDTVEDRVSVRREASRWLDRGVLEQTPIRRPGDGAGVIDPHRGPVTPASGRG